MAQSKDPVLQQMRAAAVSKHVYDDFPAVLALLASLGFWNKRDENPYLRENFIQIIMNAENFAMSFDELEEVCAYREKTLRLHCTRYIKHYLREYKYYRTLPLPMLVSRYIEFCMDPSLRYAAEEYFRFPTEGIAEYIAGYPCPSAEKELSLHMYYHFMGQTLIKAG